MTESANPRVFVRLTIAALGGKVQGRTKLQKSVFFVGLLTGDLEQLGYNPHYYGPYSPVVAEAVESDRSLGFLDLQVRGGSGDGFELSRYDYQLSDDGTKVVEQLKATHRELWTKIDAAAKKFQKAVGNANYVDLSIAAKVRHLRSEEAEAASPEDIASAASALGWRIDAAQVRKADECLAKLRR